MRPWRRAAGGHGGGSGLCGRASLFACTVYAVPVGGANGDGVWRSLVTIVESIDPRQNIFQPAVYGRLICTVIYMSDRDRLLTKENANPHLTPPPDLRWSHCAARAHCLHVVFHCSRAHSPHPPP